MTAIMVGIGFSEILSASELIIQVFDFQEEFKRTTNKVKKIFDWIETCPQ